MLYGGLFRIVTHCVICYVHGIDVWHGLKSIKIAQQDYFAVGFERIDKRWSKGRINRQKYAQRIYENSKDKQQLIILGLRTCHNFRLSPAIISKCVLCLWRRLRSLQDSIRYTVLCRATDYYMNAGRNYGWIVWARNGDSNVRVVLDHDLKAWVLGLARESEDLQGTMMETRGVKITLNAACGIEECTIPTK